ncbi:hypothetical protein PCC8801_1130 [Rippkaea orientalis PCC 8801]|uniref:Uncharacterized protein n=1 Tax=Rippkaea orientalis (strain PCC 8801 / RF-1) TaxID=41431 RepID=B7K264_RIPO1|nr:hypothetical protein [Rippkaea orientalis]ACK65200.1 hypothetical protein PCC8801_1130 [Rippkaea orientalis PCC 8801]
MLERLLLAGTVTSLLYFSVQVSQSSVTPTRMNQPLRYVTIDGTPMLTPHKPPVNSLGFESIDS